MAKNSAITVIPTNNEIHWHAKAGDVTVYHLPKMTPEEIERYGLQKYVKAVKNDETATN